MRSFMFVVALLGVCAMASASLFSKDKPKPEPIILTKQVATFDPATAEFKYENGGTCEDVTRYLVSRLQQQHEQTAKLLKDCKKQEPVKPGKK